MAAFSLGRLVVTKAINEEAANSQKFSEFLCQCLTRYTSHDWGDICEEDKQYNDMAIINNDDRIFASYKCPLPEFAGVKIWIITEWDRSVTTILFPEDY